MTAQRPRTTVGLEINEAPDGLVVYDTATNQVHYLNPSAAAVFVLATGQNTLEDIAAELQQVFDLPAPPHDTVQACLMDLAERKLVS